MYGVLMSAMSNPIVQVFMEKKDGFDITGFLTGLRNSLGVWGSIIMGILGAAALIVAAYQVVSGLISHGKKQTNWFVTIGLIIVGAMFVGWALGDFANFIGSDTINNIKDEHGDPGIVWGYDGVDSGGTKTDPTPKTNG